MLAWLLHKRKYTLYRLRFIYCQVRPQLLPQKEKRENDQSSKLLYVLMFCFVFKGAQCSFEEEIQTQNFNINNIEVIIQTQKYSLFFTYLNKQAVLRGK